MDIYVRSIVTYGIFFLGSQVVYFGMKFNGSASPRNPIWHLVNGFHSLITYGTLLVVVIFIFIEFVFPLALILIEEASKYLQRLKAPEPIEYPKLKVSPEEHQEIEKRNFEHLEKDHDEYERHLEEQRRIEAKKKEEETLQKKKIVEERKSRTAEEVTRSALDDFL